MRIAQIHNRYRWAGGEDTIVETEAGMLEAAGNQVKRVRAENPARPAASMGRLLLAPTNPLAAAAVARQVRDWGADVAHVHNTWYAVTPELFHRLDAIGVPTVMTIQNYRLVCSNGQLFRDGRPCQDCVGRVPWPGVVHACYRGSRAQSVVAGATIALAHWRRTWDRVARFLAPSNFVKQALVDAGLPAERITARPNVIDDPGPRAEPPSRSRTVVYAGRLSAEKGVATLLEGWRHSELAARGFTLEVVGDGPLADELRRSAPAGATLTGWASGDELRRRMLAARALVFPSEWFENFGRVIIEAMASGLPVMASDIATPAELVAPLGPGWLVPPGSVDGWAAALDSLADDVEVDRAGRVARQRYESEYTLERGLSSLEAVYREVLSSGPP